MQLFQNIASPLPGIPNIIFIIPQLDIAFVVIQSNVLVFVVYVCRACQIEENIGVFPVFIGVLIMRYGFLQF